MIKIDRPFLKAWAKTILNWYSAVFGILATVLTFVSLDDIYKFSFCCKIVLLISIAVIVALIAFCRVFFRRKRRLWTKDSGSVNVIYGDLFKIAEGHADAKRLIVIPVNTTFDTIIEGPNVARPLVSENTLHGRWIKLMKSHGLSQDDLQKAINNSLEQKGNSNHYKIKSRVKGNDKYYDLGTCATYIEGNNCFVLLALSEFDENNKAHCTEDNLSDAIKGLVYSIDGMQGYKCYVPVMGTGLSRTSISYKDALKELANGMRFYSYNIHCEMNIVIYNKNIASIYDV